LHGTPKGHTNSEIAVSQLPPPFYNPAPEMSFLKGASKGSSLILERYSLCCELCFNDQLSSEQAFRLVLGGVGAVNDIGHKLGTKGSGILLQSI